MRKDKFNDSQKEGHHRSHKGRGELSQHRGAKTFRRGRALAFLEMMNLKRSTIKQQLEQPEFQSIQQILIGELKAIDLVINEFVQLFEIHEIEIEATHKKKEETELEIESNESAEHDERGSEKNETN